jgi:hypothetical protein
VASGQSGLGTISAVTQDYLMDAVYLMDGLGAVEYLVAVGTVVDGVGSWVLFGSTVQV